MLGPFPRAPESIDGGVAAAITYLSQELASDSGIELVGVRVAGGFAGAIPRSQFDWPIVDLPLGRGSVSTFYLRQRLRFAEILREFRPDIVHAQGADASGLLAVGSGYPGVVTIHGLLAECAKYQTNPIVRARDRIQGVLTERPTLRRAKNLIVISPYVAQYYGDEVRARTYEIPNAVSPKYFHVRRAPERGRLLFAGRISKGKGVLELVHAVNLSRGSVTKVVLAGSSPDKAYESAVRHVVTESGLADRIEFAGLLHESALLEEFARAEALVLPSFQETAPMVVQQAMAAGLAVIATRVGGVPYQIEHDVTGLLFDPVDARQLSILLRRMTEEPDLSKRLGDESKKIAIARYDAKTVAIATRKVYQSILG